MIRRLVFAVSVFVLTLGPLSAQQPPPVAPRLILRTIMTSTIVTGDQKAAIKSVAQEHRSAIQAAVVSGDRTALREAFRPVMEMIISTLTPEQRRALREAIQKQLSGQ